MDAAKPPIRLHVCGGGIPGICFYIGALETMDCEITSIFAESAGSVAAVAWACNVPFERILEAVEYERVTAGPRFGSIKAPFRRMLEKLLPDDCAVIANRRNIGIVVCQPYSRWWPLSGELKVVNRFKNKQDLVNTILSSCHIPWVMDLCARSPEGFVDGSISSSTHLDRLRNLSDTILKAESPRWLSLSRLTKFPTTSQSLKFFLEGCDYIEKRLPPKCTPRHFKECCASLKKDGLTTSVL